MVTATMAAEPS